MQSLEKPVLKPEAPKTVLSTLKQESPKGRLMVAAMPLALLALWCLASLGERTAQYLLHPAESQNLAKSQAQARKVAASVLRAVEGDPATANGLQFSTQSAFSVRRNAAIHEWNVTANSGENRHYLLRINARTKIVYAINRVSAVPLAMARPAEAGTITQDQARELARHYLQTITGDKRDRSVVWDNVGTMEGDATVQTDDSVSYIFTCRHYVSGGDNGLIKIGVDRQTGDLSYYWNPSGVK